MSAGVTLKGFSKTHRKLKSVMPTLNKTVPKTLGKYGALMVKYARSNHKFKTQTGQGERAITFKLDKKNWILHFYIDEVRVYSNGWNYLWIQNDGSAGGYKQGKISPPVTPKGKGSGVQADDFMGRAWDKYVDDLTAELNTILTKALS